MKRVYLWRQEDYAFSFFFLCHGIHRSVISLLPYFTYINDVLLASVENRGPDERTFAAPAIPCDCRSQATYSVDIYGNINYFTALSVVADIVGQGK